MIDRDIAKLVDQHRGIGVPRSQQIDDLLDSVLIVDLYAFHVAEGMFEVRPVDGADVSERFWSRGQPHA